MKIRFIGTSAFDYPSNLSEILKGVLDKDLRRSSSVLIDEHILVDCGEHALDSLAIQNIPLEQIDALFLTHLHSDHFRPDSVLKLLQTSPRLTVYAWSEAETTLRKALAPMEIPFVPMDLLSPLDLGFIKVTAFPANHTEFPVHYLFEQDEKTFFYATDGAWILYDTLKALENRHLDFLVLDGTVGDYDGAFRVAEHNSIPMIRTMLKSFLTVGLCDEHSIVMLSHIAPSLHKSHAETEELLKKDHLSIAYDGLVMEI